MLGIGLSFEEAMYKGFLAAKTTVPRPGSTILATIRDFDKEDFLPLAKRCSDYGCKFIATEGTAKLLEENGISCQIAKKIAEGVPNILDVIRSGIVDMIIDIPAKTNDINSDGFKIRRTAIESDITLMTSLDTFGALVKVMECNFTTDKLNVISLNDIKVRG